MRPVRVRAFPARAFLRLIYRWCLRVCMCARVCVYLHVIAFLLVRTFDTVCWRVLVPGNGTADEGATAIAAALADNRTLTSVDIAGECHPERARTHQIKSNTVQYNAHYADWCGRAGGMAGEEPGNKIEDDGAMVIAGVLELNTTIRSIDLGG